MAIETNPNDYNGGELVVISVIFLSLTAVAVLLRFYTRIFVTKSFQLDDWLMLVSQIVFAVSCSFVLAGVHSGMGRHNKSLPQKNEIDALMFQALATITYVMNMMFIKLSIGVFLLRLSVQKRYTWILRISMGIIAIWSLVIIFYQFFQCQPVAFQWDYTIPGGKCAPNEQFVAAAYSISVMTIVSDWLYSIMPIFMIWKVKMSMQKKLTVAFVLSLGIFASVATLIRLKYLFELGDSSDGLYTATHAMVWTLIEPGIAIVAASLVTIRPLLHKWHVSGFGSSKNTSNYGLSGYGRGYGLSLRGDAPRNDGWQNRSIVQADGRIVEPPKNGVQVSRSASVADHLKSSTSNTGVGTSRSGKGGTVVQETSLGDGSSEEYIMEGIVRTVDVTVSRDGNAREDRRHNER